MPDTKKHIPDALASLKSPIAIVTISVLAVGAAAVGFYSYQLRAENNRLLTKIQQLEESLKNSNDSLLQLQNEKKDLLAALDEAANKNKAFADQLGQVTQNLDRLKWINFLDPQLLQKYSKVYFLNENYSPRELSPIDTKYLFNKSKTLEIHDRVLPFLQRMFQAAAGDGIEIGVVSSYRSFGTQSALKSSYKVTYGSGANAFSADQGFSEHQLGTAIDVTTQAIGGSLTGFDKTRAYTWLNDHAHEYGFTLSYPKNNTYYVFEPWHWRFVGIELATKLRNEGKHFYDLDQREISTFLGNMFNADASAATSTGPQT